VLSCIVCGALLPRLSSGDGRQAADKPDKEEKIPTLDAARLFGAYDANEVAADQAYKDRKVQARGVVLKIGKDVLGGRYVLLGEGREFEILGVQCEFAKRHDDELADLSPHQSVTLRGVCKGKAMNVLLHDCELVRGK
jgi:hypothetical protein